MNFSKIMVELIKALRAAEDLGEAEVDIGSNWVDAYVLRMYSDDLRQTISVLEVVLSHARIESQLERGIEN